MDETLIQSRQNKWIKRVRRAIDRHDEEIVLEGPKMVDDAVARGWSPIAILQEYGREHRKDAIVVDTPLFREISETKTSQGIIGLFPRPVSSFEKLLPIEPRRLIALDGVQDPGNVGTIIRLCAAFDACGIVRLPGTADPWSPKAIRSSAGAIMTVPVVESTASELSRFADDHDFSIFTADSGATRTEIPGESDVLLVLGSEGRGLSKQWEEIGEGLRIAMSDRVESLNVAAAAAILLSQMYQD